MKVYKSKGGYFYKIYKNGKKKRISKKDYLKHKKSQIMKGGRVLPITIKDKNGINKNDLVLLDTGNAGIFYSKDPDKLKLVIDGVTQATKMISELEFKNQTLRLKQVQKIKELASEGTSKKMQSREAFQKTWVKSVLEKAGQDLYNNYYSIYYSKHLLTKLAKYAFIYSEGYTNKNNHNKIQSIKNEIKSLFSEYFEKHKNQFNCNITVEEGLDNNPLSLACKTGDEEIVDLVLKFNNIDEIFNICDTYQNNIFHMLVFYDFNFNMFDKILKFLKSNDKNDLLEQLLKDKNISFPHYSPLNILEELISLNKIEASKKYLHFKGKDTETKILGRELGWKSNISFPHYDSRNSLRIGLFCKNKNYVLINNIRLKYIKKNTKEPMNEVNKKTIFEELIKQN